MNIITQSKILLFVLASYTLANYPNCAKNRCLLVGHFVLVNTHAHKLQITLYLPAYIFVRMQAHAL